MTVSSSSRRALLLGGLGSSPSGRQKAEIVSLIVNAFPDHLDGVAAEIAALPGAEVHAQDPKGKLIVVLEAPTQGDIGAMANAISGIPHVLSAAMVFQATDEGSV